MGVVSESAMVLSDQEWHDLAGVCEHFLAVTRWAENPDTVAIEAERYPEFCAEMLRRREVAERVVAAA